jgi:hypothetical protein
MKETIIGLVIALVLALTGCGWVALRERAAVNQVNQLQQEANRVAGLENSRDLANADKLESVRKVLSTLEPCHVQ